MELSIYTIRAKQDYIYKTNKVLEIVGASENISNAWNVLFQKAEEAGLKVKRISELFCFEQIRKSFAKEEVDMVELFCGGGNDTVLFRNKVCFRTANKAFSFCLLKEYPGMIPMAVSTDVSGNYREDYRRLMEESEKEKNRMIPGRDQFILPFSMMDRDTFLPMTDMENNERYPKERLCKRKAGIRVRNAETDSEAIRLLDEMVTKKGEESLLAVIHADGNNMGSKIMDLLGSHTDYDYCVNSMRKFTCDTAEAFVNHGLSAVYRCQKALMEKYKNHKKYIDKNGNLKKSLFACRKIISDGDDITFICNARFAMEYAKAYVNAVQTYQRDKKSDWSYSSCAGICIFHSHYSFAEAYRLAEKACDDGAKAKVHIVGADGKNIPLEEGWVDFHYIHSGAGGDLQTIRRMQGTSECMARPWRIDGDRTEDPRAFEKLEKLAEILRNYSVSRTEIKSLGIDWENSRELGYASIQRVCGHHPGLENALKTRLQWDDEQIMRAIYDLAEVIDLWFAEEDR